MILGKDYLQSITDIIQLQPKPSDSEEIIEIRSNLLSVLYMYEFPEVIDFGVDNYNKIMKGEDIDPSLVDGSLLIGAKEISDFNKIKTKYLEETHEQMKNKFLICLTSFPVQYYEEIFKFSSENLYERHFRLFFDNLSYNRDFNDKLFDFLEQNYAKFSNKNPLIQEMVFYVILKNSKSEKQRIIRFMNEKRSKQKGRIFNLIEEELLIYQSVYKLQSLDNLLGNLSM